MGIERPSVRVVGPTRRWGPPSSGFMAIGGVLNVTPITLHDALSASSADGRNMIIGNSLIAGATNSCACTIIHVHNNLANHI